MMIILIGDKSRGLLQGQSLLRIEVIHWSKIKFHRGLFEGSLYKCTEYQAHRYFFQHLLELLITRSLRP